MAGCCGAGGASTGGGTGSATGTVFLGLFFLGTVVHSVLLRPVFVLGPFLLLSKATLEEG